MPPKRKAPPDQSQPTRRSTRARDQKDEGDVKTTDIAGPEKGVENEGKVELPPDVEYIPNFLQDEHAYEELAALDTWYHPTLKVYGKSITQSRSIAAYATHPMEMKYSGAEIEVHVPFPPVVRRICERVESKLGEKFNHVLLNRYEDGSVYIGRHSDTAENRVIAAVSLGAERTLVFTPRLPPKPILTTLSSTEKRELEGRSSMKLRLGNGSLLVMRPPTQEYWKHEIPKEKGAVGRISLTFRQLPGSEG